MAGYLKSSLFFPGNSGSGNKKQIVLAGDAGGTKVNLAIFEAENGQLNLLRSESFHSQAFSSVNLILQEFLNANPDLKPEKVCLGVAGPIFEGRVEVTNLPWHLDAREIAKATGIPSVSLLNDLEATGYGLAGLEADDFHVLHAGDPHIGGNMAILAPGTGLGEAGLFWDGSCFHPFATEGGHCDFSPRNADDLLLHDYLLRKYKVVSWESIIAGPAILAIYNFLCEIKKMPSDPVLRDKFRKSDPSAMITGAALAGTDKTCVETMRVFVRHLARESANLILKIKCTGGLLFAGGIPPKILPLLEDSWFYNNLMDCDRMQDLIGKVPVKVILNDKAPMIGAGWFGAFSSVNMAKE